MKIGAGIKQIVAAICLVFISLSTNAQCAMCRTTLENNVSNGDIGIAAGINFGILYLFVAPYTVIGLIAFFWYRASKANRNNELIKRSMAR
ncbi:MAG: hypothetical protein IPK96_09715 [Flammeovirgaceae bacterium]|jgi:hypothetical protein|nr:hypothetical protein [Flammeovirgaceae bacterium]